MVIDVLGADHSGYVSRLKAVINAFAEKNVEFEVKLVQLVKLIKNKKVLKMSKRVMIIYLFKIFMRLALTL